MKKAIFSLLIYIIGVNLSSAQKPVFTNYEYEDQSIIQGMSDNGKWAVSSGGESADSRLINLDTHESTVISTFLKTEKASDVSDDGTIIVGSKNSVPAYYSTTTKSWNLLETKGNYVYGNAFSVTSDGRYAVGTLYYEDGLQSIAALWNIATGKLETLTGLPTKDMSHTNQGQMDLRQISGDGKFILGCMSYSYLPTSNDLGGCFFFVYDREKSTYKTVGFTQSTTSPWKPAIDDMLVIMSANMSNNGKYVTGTAHMAHDVEGSLYADEYKIPFLYDVTNDSFVGYDETIVSDTYGSVVTNDGTVIDVSPEATPVREWSVRTGQYWFSFAEILQQKYNTNIKNETTYDNTGTINCISNDAKRLVSFPDPYKSYVVDLPESVSTIGEGVKLLGSYKVTPEEGSEISALKSITVTFDRNIKVIGANTSVKILDANDEVLYSSVGCATEGKTLSIRFRKGSLSEGGKYTLYIPASTIAMQDDDSQTNSDIRIKYTGRADQPVKLVSAYPTEGTAFSHIDYSTSPVMLTFDTEIAIADNVSARLFRNDEKEAFCSLTLAKNAKQLALYPSTTQYLFEGSTYRVEVAEGAVTDVAGNNPSEAISITYYGNYVREISGNDTILFKDNFDNGLGNFMQWCGDGNIPTNEMVNWDFQQNMAWGLVRDDEGSDDRMAASHSMYSPAGQSNDWLVIPQIYVPDKFCKLHFLSQSYLNSKEDYLKVIVWESNNVYNTLDEEIIENMESEGVVIFNKKQSPGKYEDILGGDWTNNELSLKEFAGKNIYIAFVNQNCDQSAIFMDSLYVSHEMNYLTALEYEESVVNQAFAKISGTLIGNNKNKAYNNAKVTLKDGNGNVMAITRLSDMDLKFGEKIHFDFTQQLSLEVGCENQFSIYTDLDGETNEIHGSIKNLAFQPQKRVVLEEYTGRACGNCPLGIMAFEKLEERYGDSFIPISIHTYNNDPLSQGLSNYTSLLGLDQLGAPSGMVNRGVGCYPASSAEVNGVARYFFTNKETPTEEDKLWADYVEDEINIPADCDIKIASINYNESTESLEADCEIRYALNADNQTVNLFTVLLEDNLSQKQQNYMSSISSPDLGEWGLGGKYGQSIVTNYLHQDVARNINGLTINGTGGYIPSTVEAGKIYDAKVSIIVPSTVQSIEECKIVVMMINANTGKVINAAIAKNDGSTAITEVNEELRLSTPYYNNIYNISGQQVNGQYKGIVIRNGKKYIQK